ncbi:cache domain-containing protein [Hoeflea prorocentri]|uniref:Cache domain-containing protein n=1 Tax=Hoeflea prorocentri TaxID=1922333 RepID=A0A9X3UF37_9HYPH|nr:cache domain-containing protein [Hoeflea prorocentri]MCY6380132.1 cache domain-containing protein [Hoeflea prorocentri]MDA5397932.1 cache domain-containing protein [Hoeflea prorocentri]
MRFKTKLLLITLLPVILISAAMIFVINFQSSRLSRIQAETVENLYLDLKHTELKNYVTLARNALTPIYASNLKTKRQAQRQAREIVQKMTLDEDSYFFIYEENGTNIVNPRLTYLVGSNWIGLEDADGRHVIRDLIDRAKKGGEFYSFIWKKPSTGEYVEKLGYSVYLDKWDWMLGTGIYLDEVSRQVAKVQAELQSNVSETRLVLFVLMLGALALTGTTIAAARLSEQRFADARLKELSARQVEFQEDERKRVSRELHDSISQLLVSARYGLESALNRSEKQGDITEPVEKSMSAIDDAISEVRRISMALRPSVLDDMGLAAAVKSLGSEFSKRVGISVDVQAEPLRELLSDEAKTALYRVIQEALTNVARHSDARNVTIKLCRHGNNVKLRLEDDGVGMPRARKVGGLGIRNMQERMDTFGGTIRFSKAKPHGLAIAVTLPIVKQKK